VRRPPSRRRPASGRALARQLLRQPVVEAGLAQARAAPRYDLASWALAGSSPGSAAIRALVRDFLDRASRGETTPEDPLSPRELEVVKLIAEGLTSEEIAEQLFISKKTVDRHRANVLEKLGMRNRVELTRYAIRRGLVVP
jgi:DNA-binding NarL/FixJ family response regulator